MSSRSATAAVVLEGRLTVTASTHCGAIGGHIKSGRIAIICRAPCPHNLNSMSTITGSPVYVADPEFLAAIRDFVVSCNNLLEVIVDRTWVSHEPPPAQESPSKKRPLRRCPRIVRTSGPVAGIGSPHRELGSPGINSETLPGGDNVDDYSGEFSPV